MQKFGIFQGMSKITFPLHSNSAIVILCISDSRLDGRNFSCTGILCMKVVILRAREILCLTLVIWLSRAKLCMEVVMFACMEDALFEGRKFLCLDDGLLDSRRH